MTITLSYHEPTTPTRVSESKWPSDWGPLTMRTKRSKSWVVGRLFP